MQSGQWCSSLGSWTPDISSWSVYSLKCSSKSIQLSQHKNPFLHIALINLNQGLTGLVVIVKWCIILYFNRDGLLHLIFPLFLLKFRTSHYTSTLIFFGVYHCIPQFLRISMCSSLTAIKTKERFETMYSIWIPCYIVTNNSSIGLIWCSLFLSLYKHNKNLKYATKSGLGIWFNYQFKWFVRFYVH